MSLTNPNKPVTEARLQEFYHRIKSYLGFTEMPSGDMGEIVSPLPSVSHGNANPTGTIISFMGSYAPDGYLACDGSTKNIADYPRLAKFFQVQFGSINKFGGDGTTTFAVPDLRGEFLRGTGTNSHTNQGNGAGVGVHQDATEHISLWSGTSDFGTLISSGEYVTRADSEKSAIRGRYIEGKAVSESSSRLTHGNYTSRPTNTSILYCIKD